MMLLTMLSLYMFDVILLMTTIYGVIHHLWFYLDMMWILTSLIFYQMMMPSKRWTQIIMLQHCSWWIFFWHRKKSLKANENLYKLQKSNIKWKLQTTQTDTHTHTAHKQHKYTAHKHIKTNSYKYTHKHAHKYTAPKHIHTQHTKVQTAHKWHTNTSTCAHTYTMHKCFYRLTQACK